MATTKIQKEYLDDELPHILSGAGAPASTPAKVGNIYIDTTSDDAYIAVGTASSSDWEKSNDGTGGGGTDISCRVYQTGVTSVTSSWVALGMGAENFDTDTMHDNATDNSRITFTTAGKYHVGGALQIGANAVIGCRIRLNGSTIIVSEKQGNSAATEQVTCSTIYEFAASDYIELMGYSGTTQNSSGDSNTSFWAYKIN